VYALNTLTRLLWALIWLALFGVFVYQFFLIIDKYLQFPVDVHQALVVQQPPKVVVLEIMHAKNKWIYIIV
jgi:hypothetical protein